MDNELFELCKEVYDKTGWTDTDIHFGNGDPGWIKYKVIETSDNDLPLYNSDYLLEKLQPRGLVLHYQVSATGPNVWYAERAFKRGIGYTPLKALLKLTLALAEAGELPKGGDDE